MNFMLPYSRAKSNIVVKKGIIIAHFSLRGNGIEDFVSDTVLYP